MEALTRELAESVGITPWQGVWVKQVENGSAAFEAGLRSGDVILQVAGTEVGSPEQFADLLSINGVPGEPLDMRALVQPRLQFDSADRELIITPDPGELRSSKTDSIELPTSPGVQAFTGLQAVELPTDLARIIFGENRPIVLVSGVLSGSPAYEAGLRSGDRLLQVDGRPVQRLDDLRRAVAERTRER